MDESPKPSRLKRWALLALKLAIVAVLFWFVRGTLFTAVRQLRDHPISVRPGWLVASGAIYLVGLLPAALFWRHVMRRLGQDARLGETIRAYYIGHLGKYVPGKAMVVVLRTGLIRSQRVNTTVAAASVLHETLTMMSVGALLAAAILAFWFREHAVLCLISLGLLLLAGLPVFPQVFRRLARLAGVGRSDPGVAYRLERLGWGTLLRGLVAMTLVWIMLATSFWAVLRAMGLDELSWAGQLPRCLAGVSLATVAGFLSLVPGGAGVREMVLAELMVPSFGQLVAVAGAVVLRLVWLVAELGISAILYMGGSRGQT
ncbi:MAG: flippase-like domain-containing protein [Pirellulales bacterium]|nr:flippase-like domain-containing protein [Pirellulales bacterium]